jgi:hypothetical protein
MIQARYIVLVIKVNRENKMKKHMNKWLVVLGLALSFSAWAESAANAGTRPDILVYIQPVEFTNPIKLWHPYSDYWFYQGPPVEGIAVDKLGKAYGKVEVCDANQSGRVLVWLQPKMFYNPQVQQFYGKVTAEVYTGIGKHIGTYVGEANVRGTLGMQAESRIKQSYALAIDHVVSKMKADNALQTQLGADTNQAAETTPCSMVTLLPTNALRRALPF